MIRRSQKLWLRVIIWLLLILPLGCFVLASSTLLAYLYWPKTYDAIHFQSFRPDNDHIVFMAHGVNDTLSTWIEPLEKLYRSQQKPAQIQTLDWHAYANNSLRCAIDGKRIGQRIGAIIAGDKQVKSVHLIAHSCGAFVIYGACRAIKASARDVTIQTTYLDPVSIYGPFWNYGIEHFGSCADYSEAYIDTEDGVPGSNEALPYTHTYDVTALRTLTGSKVPPHVWPTQYYISQVAIEAAPEYDSDPSLRLRKPPGTLEVVSALPAHNSIHDRANN